MKFHRDESLEDVEHSGQPSEVDNNQLRASLKLILLQPHKKLSQNSTVTILQPYGIWSKLKRWKSSLSGYLMSDQKSEKLSLWSVTFFYSMQQTILQIMTCDEKWTLYDNQWQLAWWLDQEAAPKHFPKPNVNQKNVMVTVSWAAAHLIHYSFLNPSETIVSENYTQSINKVHWKLQHLQLGTNQ